MTPEPIETETDDDATCCEACEQPMTDAEIDEFGDVCEVCYAANHFHCLACNQDFDLEEQSPSNKCLCLDCQAAKDDEIAQERLDSAKEAAQEAFDAILDTDDLTVILKAVAALKKLAPKS